MVVTLLLWLAWIFVHDGFQVRTRKHRGSLTLAYSRSLCASLDGPAHSCACLIVRLLSCRRFEAWESEIWSNPSPVGLSGFGAEDTEVLLRLADESPLHQIRRPAE